MQDILNQYFKLLLDAFQYDVSVFSQGWIYYWLLVPASVYLMFFILKWAVLTAPFWIPFNMICGGIKSIFKRKS